MADIIKEYSNGEITVVWKPNVCIHSTKCWHSLPEVFDPRKKPWVNIGGAGTKEIIKTVSNCPSGALSYRVNSESAAEVSEENGSSPPEVKVLKNGPYIVSGHFIIKDENDQPLKVEKKAALCRCGGSKNKPFCDGTHKKIGFEG